MSTADRPTTEPRPPTDTQALRTLWRHLVGLGASTDTWHMLTAALNEQAAQGAAARDEGRREAVRLDTRCVNCWHDKGHHVHWSDDRIGACVLVYGGGQGRCPCEQYAARPGRSSDPTEADDE